MIEGHPFTVIGVTPAGFFGETLRSDPPDLWIPVQQEPVIAAEGGLLHQSVPAWLRVIGRLHPGASTAGMGLRLTGILRQWMQYASGYPSNWMPGVIHDLPKQVIDIVPAGAGVAVMKEEYGRSLQILLAVCGMVLLIACANVANLLLARAVSRRAQTALRLALGANRRQIIGQNLFEAIVIGIGGGIAGLGFAVLAGRLLLNLAFSGARFLPISTFPWPIVLAFAFAVSLLTGTVFGAAPAWFATRTGPVEALRGVLSRSLNNLENQNFGYAIDGRVVVSINPPRSTYTIPQLESLYRKLEDGMNGLPGVRGSGLALYNPLTDNWGEMVLVSGHPLPKLDEPAGASWDRVSANYLQDFGVKLVRGRYFATSDNENTEPVAIVNEAFVKRFFKSSEDPLMQHFGLDLPQNAGTFRIVSMPM